MLSEPCLAMRALPCATEYGQGPLLRCCATLEQIARAVRGSLMRNRGPSANSPRASLDSLPVSKARS